MIELLLAACLTIPINDTTYPWNSEDKRLLVFNKTRCEQIYPDAPCLKYFVKRGKTHYWAICGVPANENR